MVELSIVIPSHNTDKLLSDCLKSVYQTKEISFEVIVVDNGSTDGTIKEVVNLQSEYKNLELIENKANLGFAKAVNQGLRKATGEFLLLLNSDTKVAKETIPVMISFFKKHQAIGVAGCQLKNPDGTIQPSVGYLPNLLNVFFWMTFIDDLPILRRILKSFHLQDKCFYSREREVGWITGAFFLTKREVLEKIGFFDEGMFMYVEEVDWCYRTKKAGYKVMFTPVTSIVHQKGASSGTVVAGIVEEYLGLKYFFSKNKAKWQILPLKLVLKIGALARYLLFGIILKHPEAKDTYAKVARLV